MILTGSIGHIGRPLAISLVQKGHDVTVITSKPEKTAEIEALGAKSAVGSVEDAKFLTSAFAGADAVYCMVPPVGYMDPNHDILAYCRMLGENFAAAIRDSGVKRVIHLSSIGADLEKGSGLILGHHYVESALNNLADVDITFIRPTAFYYNLFGFLPVIKQTGFMASNYGENDQVAWVAPVDIAAAISDELDAPPTHRKVRYVASHELSCNEVAAILGAAIGKPEMKWVVIPDEQMKAGLVAAGLPPHTAEGLVELNAGIHSGLLSEDFNRHRPEPMGAVKMEDFAKEFALAYNKS